MKTRVLSICVALPLFLAAVFLTPAWGLAILYAAVAALAQHEILHATGIVKNKPVVVIAMVCAAAVPFWVLWGLKPLPALIPEDMPKVEAAAAHISAAIKRFC